MIHRCEGNKTILFTVENRGDDWFIYQGDEHENLPIKDCPYCGIKLTDTICS